MIHKSKKKGINFGVRTVMTASRASPLNEKPLERSSQPRNSKKPYTDNIPTQFSIQKRRKETLPYLLRTKLEMTKDQISGNMHFCQMSSLKAKLSKV